MAGATSEPVDDIEVPKAAIDTVAQATLRNVSKSVCEEDPRLARSPPGARWLTAARSP
ncbi:hypothetical protein BDV10DRAFT_159634 [Aspergillus recurvatus]